MSGLVGVVDAGLSCIADDNGASIGRAVDNTLQHLQHIAHTWARVLPTNAALKSIGHLLTLYQYHILAHLVSSSSLCLSQCSASQVFNSPGD